MATAPPSFPAPIARGPPVFNTTTPPPHPWARAGTLNEWMGRYNIPNDIRVQLQQYAIAPRELSDMTQLAHFKALGLTRSQAEIMLRAVAQTEQDLLLDAHPHNQVAAATGTDEAAAVRVRSNSA
eukprot:CAMPEP_0168752780 /NCGR_PEP_ID=MMETSP0724-20121128/18582_1 /TAXON_ID=265536 /ORGANISM="Amphiprora sp., Strain CCMP467" /LENGTH=124 /DNA_ID=CAMNT_0008801079 /DNA_START=101 /DNA_END=475 /DNA_ORIENTATION=-